MLITGPTFSGYLRGRVEIADIKGDRIEIAVDGAYQSLWVPNQRFRVEAMVMPERFRVGVITVERREM